MDDNQRTGNRGPATGNRQPAMRLGCDIAERLLELGVAVVRMSADLPRGPAGRHISLQVVRSATGGGANYEEARAAESREDFVHKLGVAAKEVRETIYWLEFIRRSSWTSVDLTNAIREATELSAILAASRRTAQAKVRPRRDD
jgi:four helix bundle protein